MKVQNPIIGRARGSAGGMTFCKNYDKNVARAKAFEVSNPNTQAQQTQRNFFAELTALCADFSEDQLRCLFPSKPKTMSRRNALSKQIAESYAIDGTEKTIDYADIETLGNAPVMDFGETSVIVSEDGIFIDLDQKIKNDPNFEDNQFCVVIINVTKRELVFPSSFPYVNDEHIDITFPEGWNSQDTLHVIPFILDNKGATTQTASFGTLSVTKRPARKND